MTSGQKRHFFGNNLDTGHKFIRHSRGNAPLQYFVNISCNIKIFSNVHSTQKTMTQERNDKINESFLKAARCLIQVWVSLIL